MKPKAPKVDGSCLMGTHDPDPRPKEVSHKRGTEKAALSLCILAPSKAVRLNGTPGHRKDWLRQGRAGLRSGRRSGTTMVL